MATNSNTPSAIPAHALTIVDRPAYRAAKVDLPKPTDAQMAAQKALSALLMQHFSPEGLAELGAFITPGDEKETKDGRKYTPLMLALSIPMEPIKFVAPDGTEASTRSWVFALNVGIPKDGTAEATPGVVAPRSLSFAEFLKQTR
jgi:hypothetical protein